MRHSEKRRSNKFGSLQDKTRKKNLQILETYILSPTKHNTLPTYKVIEKDKIQPLRKKQNEHYIILNPKSRHQRKVQTECSDYEDDYIQELNGIKHQIKSLQKELEYKKSQEYEKQRAEEIRILKNEIKQLKNLQKEIDYKRFEEQKRVNELNDLKAELSEIQRELKEKRSLDYFPPINNYQSLIANPQNIITPFKKTTESRSKFLKKYSAEKQEDIEELKEQIKQLKNEVVLKKKFYNKNSAYLPSINGGKFSSPKISNAYKNIRYTYTTPLEDKEEQTNSQILWRKKMAKQGFKKVKKGINCILFVYRLRRFSQKIRLKRQNFFKEELKESIHIKVKLIRDIFIKSTQDFISSLPVEQVQPLAIVSTDSQKIRETKVALTRKYIGRFFDIIKETEFLPDSIQLITETCYFVCRHGGAGVLSNYFTSEELDIMCISKASMKICAEKNLEKSQIISFILVKIIIFNILLRSDSTKELKLQSFPRWSTNLFLIGSIIYEICRNMQAEFIQKVPMNYVIGNWKHLNFLNSKNSYSKKTINPSVSMKIEFKKKAQDNLVTDSVPNQLIQGTVSKKYLTEAYEYENWETEKRKIFNYVQLLHRRVCKYHATLKQQL